MNDGGKFLGCRLRIGKEKAFGDLRKRVTDGF